MTLRVAPNLDLPDDTITQTLAILARRGAGKTYLAKVIAEEMIEQKLPVVVLDPVGVWWGLRARADGKKAGYHVTILGGDHGDLPLNADAGKLVANLVAEEPVAIVIDMSDFSSKGLQRKFATDFAEQLYIAKSKNRTPLHVMIDEADEFCPQRMFGSEQDKSRQLGAYSQLVRRGRARGIGCTMITQRPQVLNKDVLSQIECLVVMQITAPKDRDAIGEWVQGHAEPGEQKIVEDSLASLKQGEAWFWSPAWLERSLQLVQVRTARTFDSSATPKAGEQRPEPRVLAAVDLDRLKEGMDRVIKETERNDPRKLHAEIRDLKAQLKTRPPETVVERVEAVPPWILEVGKELLDAADEHIEIMKRARDAVVEFDARVREHVGAGSRPAATDRVAAPETASTVRGRPKPPPAPRPPTDVALGTSERRALTVLARYPEGLTRGRLASLSGYSARKSTIRNTLSKLRKGGYVYPGDPIVPTEAGLACIADDLEELPVGTELFHYWLDKLGAGPRSVLRALVDAYPRTLTKDEVCAVTGHDPALSTIRNDISKLRTLGLVQGWRVSDDFMEAIDG